MSSRNILFCSSANYDYILRGKSCTKRQLLQLLNSTLHSHHRGMVVHFGPWVLNPLSRRILRCFFGVSLRKGDFWLLRFKSSLHSCSPACRHFQHRRSANQTHVCERSATLCISLALRNPELWMKWWICVLDWIKFRDGCSTVVLWLELGLDL